MNSVDTITINRANGNGKKNRFVKLEDASTKNVFWHRGKKDSIVFEIDNMMQFLNSIGVWRYYTTDVDYIFIRIENNLVESIDVPKIKRLLLDHVFKTAKLNVYRAFESKLNTLTSEATLMVLNAIEIPFFMDTKNEAYFFFQDGILKITKGREEAQLIEYADFHSLIWKSAIINRKAPTEYNGKPEFESFLDKVFGDAEKQKLIRQSIGYLLHGYRNHAFSPAVILSDDNISDNSQGGTGKGIIARALKPFVKVTREDGKSFDPSRVFSYQNIELDTKIFFIDDAKKFFSLENLFSIITEGFIVEKKNKQRIEIPFIRSPKVLITTNYAIKGDGESHKRRRIDITLDPYYNSDFTPEIDFGHMLFDDWDESEWENFDLFMLSCVQLHLDTGVQKLSSANLLRKQLKMETHPDFEEWVGRIERNTKHSKNDLLESWMEETKHNPKMKYSKDILTKWLGKYQTVGGYILENNRKTDEYELNSI